MVTPINVTMITQSPLTDSMLLMPSKLCVLKLDNFTLLIYNDFLVRYYLDEIVNIKSNNLKTGMELTYWHIHKFNFLLMGISFVVISCGALPAPKNGRKSTFAYTPGTFVKFDCDPGYVIVGEDRRWCYASAEWNWALWGDAQCIRKLVYFYFIFLDRKSKALGLKYCLKAN